MRSFLWLLAILSIAAWVGAGAFAATVVAPSAFEVLPSRALAGDLNGRVLGILDIQMAVATVVFLMAVTILRREQEWPQAARLVATRMPIVALVGCLVTRGLIAPRMATLLGTLTVPIDALSKDDPMRMQFAKLHAMSSSLMLVVLVAGLASAAALSAAIAARTRRADPFGAGLPEAAPRFVPKDDAVADPDPGSRP